ncbi:hypothetical protein [Streptomyces sp. NPDC002067]
MIAKRATIIGAIGITAGAAVIAAAMRYDKAATAVAGVAVILLVLTWLVMVYLRRWICDTTAARERYDATRSDLDAERRSYVAFQAALQGERDRLRAELAAGRAALEERLRIERERLAQEFDDQRAELIRSTFESAVDLVQRGLLDAPAAEAGARVIRLPAARPARSESATRPAP